MKVEHFDISFTMDNKRYKGTCQRFKPASVRYPMIRVAVARDLKNSPVFHFYEKAADELFFFDLPGKQPQAMAKKIEVALLKRKKKV